MKRTLPVLAGLILWFAAPGADAAHPLSWKGKPTYLPGEVLVTLKAGAPAADRSRALGAAGQAQALGRSDLYRVKLEAGLSVEDGIRRLLADDAVAAAQPNYRYYALACSDPPTDPYYAGSASLGQSGPYWPFQHIDAPAAWAVSFSCSFSGSPVTVAVVDSGVDDSQPDLPASILAPGLNTVDYPATTTDTNDDFGHGTFVAGLIAAPWDGAGLAGLAGVPGLVKVMPVKVLDDTGSGSTESIVNGMDYAYQQGVRIFNLSLGGPPDPLEQAEVQKLLDNNCVIVAAAGNDSDLPLVRAPLEYPAAYPGVISVGATDENDQPAFYTNGGQGLDLVAPGGSGVSYVADVYDPNSDIFGVRCQAAVLDSLLVAPDPPNQGVSYGTGAGTSFATPLVAGAAALLLALDPSLTNLEVATRLINSAKSLNGNRGWDPATGYGLLDVARALQSDGAQLTPYLTTFNSPNPFSLQGDGSTNITLAIDHAEPVELTIRDAGGNLVLHRTYRASDLNDNPSNPQFKSYYVSWDGRNGAGNLVAPGVYFYAVTAGGVTGRNKIVVVKGVYAGER